MFYLVCDYNQHIRTNGCDHMSDVAKTPREELECKKKYLYEHSMFWECNDGSKCQILEEDVCDLLNELNKEFEDCEKLLDSKDDFIHKFKKDIEELEISIKLFEDDVNRLSKENEQLKKQLSEYDEPKISIFNKDKGDWKWNDNNDIILNLRTGNKFYLRNSGAVENLVGLLNEQQATITALKEENEQLRMKLKGDDYIMVSEMLSNLRKTGICDGCKNKDKPVEWYLERGFSITEQICDRYEPE